MVSAHKKKFSHVGNFTGYMQIIFEWINASSRKLNILDIPAGNGLMAEQLRANGHTVTCADINCEKPDYIYADLNQPLPFADCQFDVVLSMEGIEHAADPFTLVKELQRITREEGQCIISLPNIHCIYSRLKFLCSGYFYQFEPWGTRHLQPGELIDCGHISSLSYLQLRYLFQQQGMRVVGVKGDRWKKKWLIPLLLPFVGLGWLWSKAELRNADPALQSDCKTMLDHLFSPALLWSRSLILVFEKTKLKAVDQSKS